MSSEVKIEGEAVYPDAATYWVDSKDDSRGLVVNLVDPGNRLGREIQGHVTGKVSGPYATDLRTFHAVWAPKP